MRIASAKIPIDLRVVEANTDILLLGMDWFKKYGAIFYTDKNLIEFVPEFMSKKEDESG